MKACVCIDYLSHEWSSTDLIQAYRELKVQRSNLLFKTNIASCNTCIKTKELRKLSNERIRQIRYENTVWRQMARICTRNLSYSNPLINPSRLYGPLFLPNDDLSSDSHQHNKKLRINTHPSLLTSFTTTGNNVNKKQLILKSKQPLLFLQPEKYNVSKSQQKQTVRFDPEAKQIYYLPNSPVKETLNYHHSYYFSDKEEEEEEEEEDDNLWELLVFIASYLKKRCINFYLIIIFLSLQYNKKQNTDRNSNNNNKLIKVHQHHRQLINYFHHMKLVQFCVLVISYAAWLLYQTILSIRTTVNIRITSAAVSHTKKLLN
ncbi:uncharacterized protein BX663DRAFT_527103 [Cokeromyces recurvatus]|uniref:uncharacterized protein n=1 Tax=Cokeromyces recurvatus TaxID=90255 RepID=UPI00221EB488|nr:uncharacterized protein BX663DRAFT_527103 [Cokeromyces recurvatus]KAI7897756.1 hypothetical protein BX663DRAFT_527103 [Cokeromyces recurvatus]